MLAGRLTLLAGARSAAWPAATALVAIAAAVALHGAWSARKATEEELAQIRARLAEKRTLVRRQQQEIVQLSGQVDRVAKLVGGARERAAQLRRAAHLEESREPEQSPLKVLTGLVPGGPLWTEEGGRAFEQLAVVESQSAALSESVSLLSALLKNARVQGDGLPTRWPVRGEVSSSFGTRAVSHGAGFHRGVDIRARYGTPVTASAGGQVVFSGAMSGYGSMVVVDHGNDVKTLYAHLSAIYATEGRRIRRGDVIGAVGTSGRSSGPHLHYEVRVGGEPIDPACYLQSASRAQHDRLAPALFMAGG
ncbi:MAG: peptidoglycan DD-metalloendopeptidase family protein [bacterium]|nr:peptidoglycan DD-metalloendopeptidase family protein [bacterium]